MSTKKPAALLAFVGACALAVTGPATLASPLPPGPTGTHDGAATSLPVGDIDTALTMDEQFLPKVTGTDAAKIMTPWGGMNLGITQPKMIPFKPEVFGAGLLVGLDSASAIQRIVNIGATYDAIEEYVMRKATAFRVDYGEMATRLRDESWSVVSLEA